MKQPYRGYEIEVYSKKGKMGFWNATAKVVLLGGEYNTYSSHGWETL